MNATATKNYNLLLSAIKHDLTNPINAILGYSELIIDYLSESKNGYILTKEILNKCPNNIFPGYDGLEIEI